EPGRQLAVRERPVDLNASLRPGRRGSRGDGQNDDEGEGGAHPGDRSPVRGTAHEGMSLSRAIAEPRPISMRWRLRRPSLRDERGIALVMALGFVVVLGITSASLISYS